MMMTTTTMLLSDGERQRPSSKRGRLFPTMLAFKIAVICLSVEIGALAKRTQHQRKVRGSTARITPQAPASVVTIRSIVSATAAATPEKENHEQQQQQQRQHERRLNGNGNQGFVHFFDQVWKDVAANTATNTESTVTKCRYPGTNEIIDLTFGVPVTATDASSYKGKKGKKGSGSGSAYADTEAADYSYSSSYSEASDSADVLVATNTTTTTTTTTTVVTTTTTTTTAADTTTTAADVYADSSDLDAQEDFVFSAEQDESGSGKRAKKQKSSKKSKYKSFSAQAATVDANDSTSIDSADQVDESIPVCVILDSGTTTTESGSKKSKRGSYDGNYYSGSGQTDTTTTTTTTTPTTTTNTTTPTTSTPPLTDTTMTAAEASRCAAIADGNGNMEGAESQQSSITVTVFSDSALTLEQRGRIWQVFQQYIGPTAAMCTLDMQSVLPAASRRRRRLLLRHEQQQGGGDAVGRRRLQQHHGRNLQETEIRLMNFGPPTVLSTGVGGECGSEPVDSTNTCSVLAIEVLTGYVGTAPDTAALLTSAIDSELDHALQYSVGGVNGSSDASVLVGATTGPTSTETTPDSSTGSTTPDSTGSTTTDGTGSTTDSGTDTTGSDLTPDSTGQDPASPASPEDPQTAGDGDLEDETVITGIKGLDDESTEASKSMSAGPIVGISMACMALIAVMICVLLVRKHDRDEDKLVRKMTDDEDEVMGFAEALGPANGRSSRSTSPRGGASVSSRSRSGVLARVIEDDDSAWHSKSSIPASQHGNSQRYSFPVDGYDSQPVNIRVAPSKTTDDDQSVEVESVQGSRFNRGGSANSNSRYGVCFVTTEQSAPQLQFQNNRDYQAGDTVDL